MDEVEIISKLNDILSQLYEVRLAVKENQGQGFLVNAEKTISYFLEFQERSAILRSSKAIVIMK